MKADFNPNSKPDESRAITSSGDWIVIQNMTETAYMIHTNNYYWYLVLQEELGYDMYAADKMALVDLLEDFAKRHNLKFVRAANDRKG